MQGAEVDVQHWERGTPVQLARRPGRMDAVRHLAMLGQPVHGVVGHDVHQDRAPHAAMGMVARTHVVIGPCQREGVDAPPLAGKTVPEDRVVPLWPGSKL